MCNRMIMQKEAKEAFNQLPDKDKEKVKEVSCVSSTDITRRCTVVSIEDMLSKNEATRIDFPCSTEDEGNLIPGLDDEPINPKSTKFCLVSREGNRAKHSRMSIVLPV